MTVSSIQSATTLLAYHANSPQAQAALPKSSGAAAPDRETPAENRGVDPDDRHPPTRGVTFNTYA
jgi:hypothetical protein